MDSILNADTKLRIPVAKDLCHNLIKYNLELREQGVDFSKLITPYLKGEPGVGKTSIFSQIAKDLGIQLITLVIAQFDQADLGGLPYLVQLEDGSSSYQRARPFFMPTSGKGIIFCDEVTQAFMSNQNIVAQLTNEGRIGEHALPPGWVAALASNDASNRAGTNPMPTHLKDRLAHIGVKAFYEDTVNYFNQIGVNDKITAYLKIRGKDMLHRFNPDEDVCPSPRSWEKAGTIMDNPYLSPVQRGYAMLSTVGAAATRDYKSFELLWGKMPDPDEVIRKPLEASVNLDQDIKYVLATAVAARANEKNAGNVIKFVERLSSTGEEFSQYLVSSMIDRTGGLKSPLALRNKEVRAYLRVHARDLYMEEIDDVA